MKSMSYLNSLIEGQRMGSSIPVRTSELEMLKRLITADLTLAIQHYIDQQAKELPVLPDAKYIGDDFGYTEEHMKAYGQQCAAHARETVLSELIVDFKRRAACISSKAGYSEGLRNGYLGAATAIEALKVKGCFAA